MDVAILALISMAMALAIMDGLNNAANAISWAIGGGVVTLRRALIIASIFEVIGSLAFGLYIVDTISHKLIVGLEPMKSINLTLHIYISSIVWSILASIIRVPISFSMAIIGSIIGSTAVYGEDVINWATALCIFAGWLSAFIISIILTPLLLKLNDRLSKHWDVNTFLGGLFVVLVITILISRPLYIDSIAIFMIIFLILYIGLLSICKHYGSRQTLISLILVAMMHGANDSALISSILILYLHGSGFSIYMPIIVSSLGIAMGILLWGHRVANTFVSNISFLDVRYVNTIYVSEFITIALLLKLGLPTPISLVTIGTFIGFGIYRGINSIRISYAMKSILITLASTPACIILSYTTMALAKNLIVK